MPGPATIYSPLEALLLFQSLRTYGISPVAFTKVAEQLNNDPQIRSTAGFDPARLTPDALRDFFLRVWKDELRHEEAPNGTAPSSPRKRKAPSPTLPSIQDAANNADLLPKLVVKLYGRYREQVVADIREDERRHNKLKQEVAEIQRGDWDTRLQQELDNRRRSQAFARSPVNGDNKNSIPTPISTGLLQPPHNRRDGPPIRSPSPNSTSIELPKTVPRHLQSQPHSTSSPQGRPLAAQPGPSHYRGTPALSPHPPHGHSHSPLNQQSPGRPVQQLAPHNAPYNRSQIPMPPSPYQQYGQSPSPLPPHNTAPLAPYGARPVIPGQYPGTTSPHPSQRGGIMLPPFQVAPQPPTPLQQHQAIAQAPGLQPKPISRVPSEALPIDNVSTPQASKAQPLPTPLVLSISKMLSNPSLNNTPVSSPGAAKRLAETRWKETPDGATLSSPARPRSRSVSPISDRAPSPEADAKLKTRRPKPAPNSSLEIASSTRSGRFSRRTRGASAASSVVDPSVRGRTRSQSVNSATSDHTTKLEPSTPVEPMDIDTPMRAPSSARRTTRGKRKRSPTATSEMGDLSQYDQVRSLPIPRTSVLAVRNFQRLSSAVMNDITSHKHASIFSNPVRDSHAEGYSSMIRRPSDLKSIKASISAGARAVNAASADTEGLVSGAQLPWSDDLVPPKGIVNSSQLERELMRMFANAVMFNPGEEDVVKDAREMCESAEASLINFKSAEQRPEAASASTGLRKRGESEVSQQPVAEEEHTPAPVSSAVGKRRKVG